MATDGPTELRDLLIADALRRGQTIRFRNQSDSMVPVIRPDDVVIARGESPAVGDIAIAWHASGWLAHRVASCEADAIEVRADNGGARDRIPKALVFGRVERIERDIETLWRRLRTALALLLGR